MSEISAGTNGDGNQADGGGPEPSPYFQASTSPVKIIGAMFGAGLTGGICVLVAVLRPEAGIQVLAWAGFLYATYMGLVAGLTLNRANPVLEIGPKGVRVDMIRPTATLDWSEIDSISSSEFLGRGVITIRPRDAAAVYAASPWTGRLMMRLDGLFGGGPVQLTTKRLNCRFKDLKAALREAWDRHRPDGQAVAEERFLSR